MVEIRCGHCFPAFKPRKVKRRREELGDALEAVGCVSVADEERPLGRTSIRRKDVRRGPCLPSAAHLNGAGINFRNLRRANSMRNSSPSESGRDRTRVTHAKPWACAGPCAHWRLRGPGLGAIRAGMIAVQ